MGQRDNSPTGKFVRVACGDYHSVAIRENGTVVTWGDNLNHQRFNSPTGIFIDIVCSGHYSVGIRENNTIFIWGNNYWGINDMLISVKFAQVSCFHTKKGLVCVGIQEDKTVLTWGDDPAVNERYDSVPGKFLQVCCNAYYSMGIREDGTIYKWDHTRYSGNFAFTYGKYIKIVAGHSHFVAVFDNCRVITLVGATKKLNQKDDSPTGKMLI